MTAEPEWEMFLRRLTLERHTGMPRWNLTRAPEHTPQWMVDTPELIAARRKALEALEDAERATKQHLRRVA